MAKDYLRAFGDQNYDYYELTQDIGFLPRGTVFVHDPNDDVRGSKSNGCLKLCWTAEGDCVGNHTQKVCGETVFFHTCFAETALFKKVKPEHKRQRAMELLRQALDLLKGE